MVGKATNARGEPTHSTAPVMSNRPKVAIFVLLFII